MRVRSTRCGAWVRGCVDVFVSAYVGGTLNNARPSGPCTHYTVRKSNQSLAILYIIDVYRPGSDRYSIAW